MHAAVYVEFFKLFILNKQNQILVIKIFLRANILFSPKNETINFKIEISFMFNLRLKIKQF